MAGTEDSGSDSSSDALADTMAGPVLAAGSEVAGDAFARSADDRPGPGSAVGRYLITGVLGAGGMSVVYSARDPELGREVAVKLLDADATRRDGMQARLVREAHALARLVHPNVAVIHDVGTVGRQVFLVQEHLDGGTLGAWTRADKRAWRDVVDMYRQAGRGLAAAHAAGLVHRDFKPDNVLLGRDGRVRVVDFGLVRPTGESTETTETTDEPSGSPLDGGLTATGAVMGTPAFMAPEQHQGLAADPRSDQFSFCVALWSALYGAHPFGGQSRAELAARAAAGRLVAPRDPRGVPGRIHRALERGLAADPADRFASMEALLAELDEPSGRARWPLALAAAGVLLGGGALAAGLLWPRERAAASPCSDGRDRLAEVWGPEQRAHIETSFAASGAPFAADAARGVGVALDDWGDSFAREHQDACADTRVRAEHSEEMLDRRMACLDRRRNEVHAFLRQLEHPDRPTIEQAVRVALSLNAPADCGDASYMLTGPAPPPEPVRAEVAAIRGELDDVNVLVELGRLAEAHKRVTPLVDRARATGHRPVLAAAQQMLGIVLHKLGAPGALEALDEAALSAEAAGDDFITAETSILTVEVLGMDDKADEARVRARRAEAALTRLGNDPALVGSLARSLSMTEMHAGRHQEALAHIRRAMDIDSKRGDEPSLATDRHDLGAILLTMGNYDEGVAVTEAVLRYYEETRGPRHPSVAGTLENLAAAFLAQSRLAEAEAAQRRALAIRIDMSGADSLDAIDGRSRLAMLHSLQGRQSEARDEFERILPALLRVRPAESDEVLQARNGYLGVLLGLGDYAAGEEQLRLVIAARRKGVGQPMHLGADLGNLASVLSLRGRHREAEAAAREALAVFDETVGRQHPSAAFALNNLADAERAQGHLAPAEAHYRSAQAVFEGAFGGDHPAIGHPLTGLGRIQLQRGRPAEARPLLERALALRAGGDPFDLGETQLALARAVIGTDPAHGRKLGEAAVASYRKAGARARRDLAVAEAWLAGRH